MTVTMREAVATRMVANLRAVSPFPQRRDACFIAGAGTRLGPPARPMAVRAVERALGRDACATHRMPTMQPTIDYAAPDPRRRMTRQRLLLLTAYYAGW